MLDEIESAIFQAAVTILNGQGFSYRWASIRAEAALRIGANIQEKAPVLCYQQTYIIASILTAAVCLRCSIPSRAKGNQLYVPELDRIVLRDSASQVGDLSARRCLCQQWDLGSCWHQVHPSCGHQAGSPNPMLSSTLLQPSGAVYEARAHGCPLNTCTAPLCKHLDVPEVGDHNAHPAAGARAVREAHPRHKARPLLHRRQAVRGEMTSCIRSDIFDIFCHVVAFICNLLSRRQCAFHLCISSVAPACAQEQNNSDSVLDDVACMLGCTRSSLHGGSTLRGVPGNWLFVLQTPANRPVLHASPN